MINWQTYLGKWSVILVAWLGLFLSPLTTFAENSFWQQARSVFQSQQQQYPGRTKIILWHSYSGALNYDLQKLINEFNQAQQQYAVIAVRKSDYQTALTSAATAYRSNMQPNILLVYEIGTAIMVHANGAVIPLSKLMKMTGVSIPSKDFWPVVRNYYSVDGQLAGFPFNSSAPVLFYNKDILKKAGVDHPPATWQQFNAFSQKLRLSGQRCTFTAAYPSWTLLEELTAWNDLPFASDNNGFDSLKPTLFFNNRKIIDFLTQLQQWSQQGVFTYGGRAGSSDSLFTSGKCAMTLQSSSMIADYTKVVPFHLGVTVMPFWATKGETLPQNAMIGGGAFWTLSLPAGSKQALNIYKGIALFYQFLSQPRIQAQWAKDTGYIPVTKSAFQYLQKQGFYQRYPQQQVALQELNHAPPKPYTSGIRLGNFPLIRQVNDAMLENILSSKRNVASALQQAIQKDNQLIMQFYQENR